MRVPLVSRWLQLYVSAEVGLGGRPRIDAAAALAPVEPRLALTVGLVISPRSAPVVAVEGGDAVEGVDAAEGVDAVEGGDAVEGAVESSATTVVSGRVLDPSGSPVAGATVHVLDSAEPHTLTAADGTFTLEGVPLGAELVLEADGYVAWRMMAGEGRGDTVLERALPSGALRGLVRSHRRRSVTATIHVEPGDLTATTDADGVFEVTLAPGRYDVTIEAAGHQTQRRSVEVEVGGVTVLNVDLRISR